MCAVFCLVVICALDPQVIRQYVDHYSRNLIFGVVTSIMVGNVLLPRGAIEGILGVIWRSVSGLGLYYLLGLIFMFFNVSSWLTQTRQASMQILQTYIDPTLSFINY